MIKYSLLHKDESSQVSYFYNLEDGFIYAEQILMDKAAVQKASGIGGACGAFAVLTYNGESWTPQTPSVAFMILALLGMLLGWFVAFFVNRRTSNRVLF